MKNLRNGLLALAFVAGIGGAFATKAANAPKFDDPIYQWSQPGSPVFTGTVSQAQTHYNCNGAGSTCATGSLVSGEGNLTEEIKRN